MSLEHAILGFLSYEPLSGYDLKKVFDTSVRHFWAADQSQIYRTLDRLARRGWATIDIIPQVDRPQRKVYHITQIGQDELQRWLTTPLLPQEPHNAAMIKVFFSGRLPDDQAIGTFKEGVAFLNGMLAALDQIPTRVQGYAGNFCPERDFSFWMLTLEYGVKTAQMQLALLQEIITRLERKSDSGVAHEP